MPNLSPVHRVATASLIAGFAVMSLPATSSSSILPSIISPSLDPTIRDYRDCTADLLRLEIPPAEADLACSRSFKPTDFAQCVVRISRDRSVPATTAVTACRQVRRPVELGSCYVDIRNQLRDNIAATDVLNSCRRSLLPARYANCVVGVSRADRELTAPRLLETCLDAADLPQELDPTFIPFDTATPTPLPQQESPLLTPTPEPSPMPTFPPPTGTPEPAPTTPVPALY